MNRRKLILSLGVLPFTLPVAPSRAVASPSVERLVAAPPAHVHELAPSGYCPICRAWVPGPADGTSLMPVGIERTIPPQEMADLIAFIKNWRYLDGAVPLAE